MIVQKCIFRQLLRTCIQPNQRKTEDGFTTTQLHESIKEVIYVSSTVITRDTSSIPRAHACKYLIKDKCNKNGQQ